MAILRCENCGAMVRPEEGKFIATCEYCGAEMTVFESTAEFEVDSKGVLVQYNGKGGDVIVPDDVRVIGKECFLGNERIFSVRLPNSIKEIQESAFRQCIELEEINLPEGLETLANHVFYQCSSLKEIVVPDGVFSLKKSVFCDCSSLSAVTLGSGIRTIGDWVFGDCTKLENLELPPNVKSLGENCFRGCASLQEITIPDKVQIISEWTFYGCHSLRQIVLPDGIWKIGCHAFTECGKLEEFICPPDLKVIEKWAFQECSALKTLKFNDGLQCIGSWAFEGCVSLTGALCFPSSLTNLSRDAMPVHTKYANITSISIGGKLTTIDLVLATPNVTTIHFNEGVEAIAGIVNCCCREKICEISFPTTVHSFVGQPFAYCTSLREVVLPDLLTEMPEAVFDESGLRRIVVSDKFKSRGWEYYVGSDNGGKIITKSRLAEQKQEEKRRQEQQKQEEKRRQEQQQEEKKRQEQQKFRSFSLCQHCGGEFKGLLSKKCSVCGRPKDY